MKFLLISLILFSGIEEERKSLIVKAAEKVGPAVVSISVISTRVVRETPFWEDPFFRHFFREFFPPYYFKEKVVSLGSGVIIHESGLIVTNEHVVHNAEKIKVTLPDGREFDAKILGTSERLDLALLKIDSNNLPTAPLGSSDDLLIGEWVVAIGNPFGFLLEDLEPTVTVGVVSALHRTFRGSEERIYRDMIQTDAAINPGNSGGPLVNIKGEVVGINTFIITKSGGYEGVGFAIPINTVKKVIPELKKYGRIREGYLGVSVQNISEDMREAMDYKERWGVIVVEIESESPLSGRLKEGEIIEKVNGRKIYNVGDWEDVTYALIPGDKLVFQVWSKKGRRTIEAVASEYVEKTVEIRNLLKVVELTPSIARRRGLSVTQGLLVISINTSSLLWKVGVREGDVIIAINGIEVREAKQVERILSSFKRGLFTVLVERRGRKVSLSTFFF